MKLNEMRTPIHKEPITTPPPVQHSTPNLPTDDEISAFLRGRRQMAAARDQSVTQNSDHVTNEPSVRLITTLDA